MKNITLIALAAIGLASCSQEKRRFEVLKTGGESSVTVLFDRETEDVLTIGYGGEIRNEGHFGDRPATGQRQ